MIRSDLTERECPLTRAMGEIGDGWMLLTLWAVLNGHTRFEALQERLGVARNILSDRLRRLVDLKLLEKKPLSSSSRRCEYVATAKSEPLREPLQLIHEWGQEHCPTPSQTAVIAAE